MMTGMFWSDRNGMTRPRTCERFDASALAPAFGW